MFPLTMVLTRVLPTALAMADHVSIGNDPAVHVLLLNVRQLLRSMSVARQGRLELAVSTPPFLIANLVISVLLSWDMDLEFDKFCRSNLSLSPLPTNVAIGFPGPCGFSCVFAPGICVGKTQWAISSRVTALHLLAILAIARAALSYDGKLVPCASGSRPWAYDAAA